MRMDFPLWNRFAGMVDCACCVHTSNVFPNRLCSLLYYVGLDCYVECVLI